MYIRPNWHPKLQAILGDISGQIGYITRFGTFELLGPLFDDPNIQETSSQTTDRGPTILFSAQ
jgi:hypothetical protein